MMMMMIVMMILSVKLVYLKERNVLTSKDFQSIIKDLNLEQNPWGIWLNYERFLNQFFNI